MKVPVDAKDQSIACVAKPRSMLRDHVQYRLNICRRTGNDAQDFTRSGLLFQSFLEFLKQSHVLDSDYSLVGEGLEENNLFISEGTRFDSKNYNRADRKTVAQ